MSRYRDTQLQVTENLNWYISALRVNVQTPILFPIAVIYLTDKTDLKTTVVSCLAFKVLSDCPANTRHWPNVVLMLGHRLWRRPNIKTTLGQRLVGGVEASVWPARITRDLWASSEVRSWGGLYCAQGYWLQLTPVTRWINKKPGQKRTKEDEDETPAPSNQSINQSINDIWKKIFHNENPTKHLYSICAMLDQRRRRWADVIQMLCKCFVFVGNFGSKLLRFA